jgi:hypothetical protein
LVVAVLRATRGRRLAPIEWDLGLQGIGVLALMSVAFGVVAQLVFGRATTSWIGLIVAAVHFVSGLFISEVWFGWATQEELQPNIDGLSFDEVLLAAFPAVVVVLVLRHLGRRRATADLR